MSKVKKINELSMLYDAYKSLLTENQKDVFLLYFFDDFSLAEISEKLNVSRSSVGDTLKNTEEKIVKLEEKLGLAARNIKFNAFVDELDKNGMSDISKILKEILT